MKQTNKRTNEEKTELFGQFVEVAFVAEIDQLEYNIQHTLNTKFSATNKTNMTKSVYRVSVQTFFNSAIYTMKSM